jgi:hypothetical protein
VRAPAAQPKAAAAARKPASDIWPAPREVDTATTEKDRTEAARAIGSLPMVGRALWSSQSTLLVYLNNTSADAKSAICPLLERYPELVASRVQLQPPEGSGEAVRFFQCRAY